MSDSENKTIIIPEAIDIGSHPDGMSFSIHAMTKDDKEYVLYLPRDAAEHVAQSLINRLETPR